MLYSRPGNVYAGKHHCRCKATSLIIIIIIKCIYIAHIQMIKMLYVLYKKKNKIEAG